MTVNFGRHVLCARVRTGLIRSLGAMRAVSTATLGISICLMSSLAFAGDGDPEALFRQGRTLLSQGNYAEACVKFAESYRLDKKLGTLLNLAGCHELQGKTATAYAEYEAAAVEADQTGRAERASFARGQAKALEKKLSRVVVRGQAPPATKVEVLLDGRAIGELGGSFAADPGEHLLAVRAAGHREWSRPVQVEVGPWSTTIDVPPLEALPQSEQALEPEEPKGRAALRTTGFVLGGLGLVSAGVGTYFGLRTFALKDEADALCNSSTTCPAGEQGQAGRDKQSEADSSATMSTVFFVVGGAAIAASVVLILTSSKSKPAPTALTTNGFRLRF